MTPTTERPTDGQARHRELMELRASNRHAEADELQVTYKLDDLRARYIAGMPADIRAQVDSAHDAARAAAEAVTAAQAACERSRAELVDAEATQGTPEKRLETLRESWHDARARLDRAAADAELRAEVADRIESRYVESRFAEDREAATAAASQAVSDYRAAFADMEQSLTVVASARAQLETAIRAERIALERQALLVGGTVGHSRLPTQLPSGIPDASAASRAIGALRIGA